jgi:hypothetical protein
MGLDSMVDTVHVAKLLIVEGMLRAGGLKAK